MTGHGRRGAGEIQRFSDDSHLEALAGGAESDRSREVAGDGCVLDTFGVVVDAARLDASLGRSLDEDQVAELRGVIDSSGAHEQVEAVIGELSSLALAALDRAHVDDGARLVLRELASAATDRVV